MIERISPILRLQSIAYGTLRESGWVVQSGLNYGADFLLYRLRPENEHSPYAVVIQPFENNELTWRQAVALNRVSTTAKKRLLIAFVSLDGKVRFLKIKRWTPEEDRQSKKLNSI